MIDSEENFESFAREIASLNNLSIETARDYAALIGDTPELDGEGLVVVRDADDKEIVRIRLGDC